MNSYDVFDTLIVRWYKDPMSIFVEMEKLTGIVNFVNLRKFAEFSCNNPNLNDIYDRLQHECSLSDEQTQNLKELELSLEHKMSSPIMSNMLKLNDGDILISDMYLSSHEILSILTKNKLNKNIKLYVSNGGKSSGWIWSTIDEKDKIDFHYGDNYHSDVISANEHGISGCHDTTHEFLEIENKIFTLNPQLAFLCRILRLLNPYKIDEIKYALWNEASHFMIPINILFSFIIKNNIEHHKYNNILFSSRDCYYLFDVFCSLFSYLEYSSIYFDVSRRMYYEPTEQFIKYAKTNMESSLVIDLQGTGKSFDYFCNMHYIKSNYLVLIDTGDVLYNKCGVFSTKNATFSDKIEKINYAPCGSLISYTDIPIRDVAEYDIELLSPYSDVTKECISLINSGFALNDENAHDLLYLLLSELEHDIKIDKFILHKDNYDKQI